MQEEDEEKRSILKLVLSLIFIVFAVFLLVIYWFIPFHTIEFGTGVGHSNFTMNNSEFENMQFYSNMRYSDSMISYRIYDCPLRKQNDMERAFEIISNDTLLSFYSVENNEQISVTCDSGSKIKGSLFIAGEGGPTNITKSGEFNVIVRGSILLIRASECSKPNVAIHELLHALGFDHSKNPNNIMYNVSNCKQTIGEDTINLINKLYSIPGYPDLSFENVSAIKHGIYMDTNMSVRNNGLKKSEKVNIEIYADEKLIEEVELRGLEIGYGKKIMLSNVRVFKLSVDELKFVINSGFNELDKKNNEVVLK